MSQKMPHQTHIKSIQKLDALRKACMEQKQKLRQNNRCVITRLNHVLHQNCKSINETEQFLISVQNDLQRNELCGLRSYRHGSQINVPNRNRMNNQFNRMHTNSKSSTNHHQLINTKNNQVLLKSKDIISHDKNLESQPKQQMSGEANQRSKSCQGGDKERNLRHTEQTTEAKQAFDHYGVFQSQTKSSESIEMVQGYDEMDLAARLTTMRQKVTNVIDSHTKKNGKYVCQFCSRKIHSKQCLRIHLYRLHCKMKPWKCSFCDKHFALNWLRNRHEVKHIDRCNLRGIKLIQTFGLNWLRNQHEVKNVDRCNLEKIKLIQMWHNNTAVQEFNSLNSMQIQTLKVSNHKNNDKNDNVAIGNNNDDENKEDNSYDSKDIAVNTSICNPQTAEDPQAGLQAGQPTTMTNVKIANLLWSCNIS